MFISLYSYGPNIYGMRERNYFPLCFNFLFYLIQIDPFLSLVEDHKLKAVNPDQLPKVAYGCQEDDASAINTLSNISISTEHSRGTLVYEIVKSLEDMCNVSRFSITISPTKLLVNHLVTKVNCFSVRNGQNAGAAAH